MLPSDSLNLSSEIGNSLYVLLHAIKAYFLKTKVMQLVFLFVAALISILSDEIRSGQIQSMHGAASHPLQGSNNHKLYDKIRSFG